MSDTTFVDQVTVIETDWLQDVNDTVYDILGNPSSVSELLTTLGSAIPTFQAARSASISDSLVHRLFWNIEEFDNTSAFTHDADGSNDTAENRWTPQVAGKYYVYSMIQAESPSDGDVIVLWIYKNGSSVYYADFVCNGIYDQCVNIDAVIDMNGTTDYIEIWAKHADCGLAAQQKSNYFGAFWVAP